MQDSQIEKQLSRILGFGAMFVTVFIVSGSVTDPVNVTKFLALGVVALPSLFLVLLTSLRAEVAKNKIILLSSGLFTVSMGISVYLSKSPLSQNLYGTYGRNNGLLTYLFLLIIFLSATVFVSEKSSRRIVVGLLIAGMVNVLYCGWVLAFGDFVGWYNPYGNILGTLGNPNFIGAFLGVFSAVIICEIFLNIDSRPKLVLLLILYALIWIEIMKSHAIQGRVVGALGAAIVIGYWIRSKYSKLIAVAYISLSALVGFVALLGSLQIGPLTDYIYKASVSLRGQYWLAGWNTGNSHPVFGVGMDSFGDWYRRMRDPHALEMPGVNTVVNAAHNVPIDIFAFGGWILFGCYSVLVLSTLASIIRFTLRNRNFDPTFVALVAGWVGYHVQSIISINQIGLAVWGWLIGGALIAYEKSNRLRLNTEKKPNQTLQNKRHSNSHILHISTPVTIIAGLIGLILALPPFTADVKWRSAQVSKSVIQLEESLKPSYFNPATTNRYLTTVQIFEQNQFFDLSHKYALEAVKWNPESFELWKILYLIRNSTIDEKNKALDNMKRLDPLNPDVTEVD